MGRRATNAFLADACDACLHLTHLSRGRVQERRHIACLQADGLPQPAQLGGQTPLEQAADLEEGRGLAPVRACAEGSRGKYVWCDFLAA